MPENTSTPFVLQLFSLLNSINHILIGLVGLFITALAYQHDFKDTALHAFLTTIGFHVLVAEALMSHYSLNPFTNSFSRRTKSKIHGVLQLVGGSLVLIGSYSKFDSTDGEHFGTWHGKVGLAASFMCVASLLGGTLNFFQPKLAHKIYTPAEIKLRHNFFGMITFTLAMTTIVLGYRTQFFEKYVEDDFVPFITFATIFVYFLTMIGPLMSLLYKLELRKLRTQ